LKGRRTLRRVRREARWVTGAGKKDDHKIIGLGKKKPSTDEQTSSAEEDIPTCGYLNVLSNNRWRERWCRLKDNQLLLHKDRADLKTHTASLPLRGCEVSPGLDSKHPFAFRLLRNGQEVGWTGCRLVGQWTLGWRTGSTTDPCCLVHYDYIDVVETTANVIQLAKQSFCFTSKRAVSPNPYLDNPVNSYACPSGMALHYDDVPINGTDPEALYSSPATGGRRLREEVLYENADPDLYENMPSPKLATRYSPKPSRLASSSSSSSSSHYKTPGPVKSKLLSSSSTNTKAVAQLKGKKASVTNGAASKQKYRYGKNRVEADAKRLQAKEEELIKRKQDIRNRKRSAASLAERLKKVEDECKLKEDERVSLELELTEVKESLKKALNGGSPVLLRRTVENSPISSCDTSDTESCSTLPEWEKKTGT
ncbi:unnamed protein product, partial [Coregonus sp. 'balchen']